MIETYQVFLQKSCLAVLGVFAFGVFVLTAFSAVKGIYARVRRTGRLNVLMVFLAIGAMVVYGGKKPTPGPDPDPTPTPGPVDPSDPTDPTDPSDPSDPTDPTDPSDPSDPTDPTDPSDPTPVDPTPDPDDPVYVVDYYLYKTVSGAAPTLAASEYNGYLYSENGEAKGTIQVKVGKPNKNTHLASVKAIVQMNGKKISLKAVDKGKVLVLDSGTTEASLAGGGAEACSVVFGTYGLSGRYGAYNIDGARNLFSSKDKDGDRRYANSVLAECPGPFNVAWDGGVVSVQVSNNGKAKASGSFADGAKLSAGGMFLIGERYCCVPLVARKGDVAFNIWIDEDGSVSVVGLEGDVIAAGMPGKTLAEGAKFHVGKEDLLWSRMQGNVLAEYLPDGVEVSQSGTKWTLPKAGKLAMKNGEIDVSKAGDNASALKLSYKAKDGSFKGSFKVYADVGGKLKATSAKVAGVMIDGRGYGTASVKDVGGAAITVSR